MLCHLYGKYTPLIASKHIEVRDPTNGIFGSWARWTRAPPDVQSCCEAAVVAVTWKLRSTFKPGDYIWRFAQDFRVVVRDI